MGKQPPRDGTGARLPRACRAPFHANIVLDKLKSQLRDRAVLFYQRRKYYEKLGIDISGLMTELYNVAEYIRLTQPYVACSCLKGCPLCKQRGWMSRKELLELKQGIAELSAHSLAHPDSPTETVDPSVVATWLLEGRPSALSRKKRSQNESPVSDQAPESPSTEPLPSTSGKPLRVIPA